MSNFLLSQVSLAFPDDPSDEPRQYACGLLDLSRTSVAAATLAMHAAAILEGSTSLHAAHPAEALNRATQLAREARVEALNLVVAVSAADAGALLPSTTDRLSGVWIAVTESIAPLARATFDLVITTRRKPTLEAWSVFRMLSSLMAKETYNCMDLEDFVDPLKAGLSCHLLDAYLLPGCTDVHFASTEDESMLRRAAGIVIVHQLEPDGFGLRQCEALINSVRNRAPQGIPLTFHWPVAQRADLQLGALRQVDILVTV